MPCEGEREREREPAARGTWVPGPRYEVMRELPLALPLRLWGDAHSSLQKRHQVRSARVRRHTVTRECHSQPPEKHALLSGRADTDKIL